MFNIKIISLLIIFSTVMLAFRCNSSGSKKEETEVKKKTREINFNHYFPVKEGNMWVYINEAPRKETETFTVKASDIKKVDDGIQVKMSSFPYLTKDDSTRSIKVKTNGEIEISDYFGITGIIIPSDDKFKTGYEWPFGLFSGIVTSDKQTVTTEAGTFEDCYYVLITEGFTFSFEMWFKNDVGIVKWGANRTNPPSVAAYYVLKEYKLN